MRAAWGVAVVGVLLAGCASDPKSNAPAPAPSAASVASAARGLTITEKWCADCHIVKAEQRRVARGDMKAPPFGTVAARPEVDAGYLARFMEVQHLPMTTFRLYSDEKADVVAYILSLKSAR
jgi:mono/diheme cytochrome c family protein